MVKTHEAVAESHRLFVYGTLMRGERAEHLLAGASFVRDGLTVARYCLLDLGRYPALTSGTDSVHGELYEVPASLIAELDRYEEVPTLYTRESIELSDGSEAETYVIVDAGQSPRIPSGSWKDRSKS